MSIGFASTHSQQLYIFLLFLLFLSANQVFCYPTPPNPGPQRGAYADLTAALNNFYKIASHQDPFLTGFKFANLAVRYFGGLCSIEFVPFRGHTRIGTFSIKFQTVLDLQSATSRREEFLNQAKHITSLPSGDPQKEELNLFMDRAENSKIIRKCEWIITLPSLDTVS
jgi:hypothetical protein